MNTSLIIRACLLGLVVLLILTVPSNAVRREGGKHIVFVSVNGRPTPREVKLGCVFTQTATDKDGRPIRDPDSTTYVAAIAKRILPQALLDRFVARGSDA